MTTAVEALGAWLEQRRAASQLRVDHVTLADCAEWTLETELRHSSGRFFSVVGAEVSAGPYAGWRQPLLHQPDVGLLGFLVRRGADGIEWLVQAKTEPGNVGGTQAAPTVQATQSNYERVHGGAATRYLEDFTQGRHPIADVTASEQGTRFLHKRNRNVVAAARDGLEVGPAWRWVPSAELRRGLVTDFVINTDARSVLVCAPWDLLADGTPFGRVSAGGFRGRLARSHAATSNAGAVIAELERRRAGRLDITTVPLTELAGWTVDEWGIQRASGDGPRVLYVSVEAADREVASWCQPLLAATDEALCELWCTVANGVLQFLFRYSPEPGLSCGVELAPTVQSDVVQERLPVPAGATVRLAATQSDEGGRFYRSVCRYRVVEVDSAQTPEDGIWLTLGDIAALARSAGTFTNESRSVISLLLSMV